MWIYEPDAETLAHPKRCKCGAEIIFCKTKAGKLAPLNAGFEIIGRMKIGTLEIIDGNQESNYVELIAVEGGANHFSTCPYSQQFRRRK